LILHGFGCWWNNLSCYNFCHNGCEKKNEGRESKLGNFPKGFMSNLSHFEYILSKSLLIGSNDESWKIAFSSNWKNISWQKRIFYLNLKEEVKWGMKGM
jgi:hypothetical protein